MKRQTSGQDADERLAPAGVDTRRVGFVAAAVIVFLGAVMGIAAVVFFALVPDYTAPARKQFPEPQLQTDAPAALARYLAAQRDALGGYHWANAEHTLVAIPIERAMEIVAQRGADGYEPIASPHAPPAPQVAPAPQPEAKP